MAFWKRRAHTIPAGSTLDGVRLYGARAAPAPEDEPVASIAKDPPIGEVAVTPAWQQARLTTVRSLRLRSNLFNPLAQNYTIANVFALEGAFDLVRVIYANDSDDAWTLDAVALAASAQIGYGLHPVDLAGQAAAWVPATTGHGGVDGIFDAAAGAARRMPVPAAPAFGSLGFAVTDWVALPSFERRDSPSGLPLLFVRSYAAGGGRFPAFGAGDYSEPDQWRSVDRGRVVRGFSQFGDHATVPGPMTATEDSHVVPIGVQYQQRARGLSVMTLGDSLTAGCGTVTGGNSFGFQACAALSTPVRPVSHVASGWSGQSAATFFARGYLEFALFRPEIVVIETSSPNGPLADAADFHRMLAGALAFAAHVERHGAVPILKTAVPYQPSEATDALRQNLNKQVRRMGEADQALVLDADAAVRDEMQPSALQRRYSLQDGHLNDAAHGQIAERLVEMLRRTTGY